MADQLSIRAARQEALRRLEQAKLPDPAADIDILVGEALGFNKHQYILKQHLPIDTLAHQQLCAWVSEREQHKPLAYILKKWWFNNREYHIHSGVLVPRSDTEFLLHAVQERLNSIPKNESVRCLELGFGSGILSIELALGQRPPNTSIAWDISAEALACAKQNAKKHAVRQIEWRRKNFFADSAKIIQSLSDYDHTLLISNPPYIALETLQTLDKEVQSYEPQEALSDGKDGLSIYQQLLKTFANHPIEHFYEIGFDQDQALRQLAQEFNFDIDIQKDFAAHPRVAILRSKV